MNEIGLRCMLILVALTLPGAQAATTQSSASFDGGARYLVIVTGLGGERYYDELFTRWAASLYEVAQARLHIPPSHISWLAPASDEAPDNVTGVSTREALLSTLAGIAKRAQAIDVVAIVLIGHGTAQAGGKAARISFNLPGPDLSPAHLANALDAFSDSTVIVVNGAPASGPFIQQLSAPGRIVITATSTAAENQHTRFAGFFVAAFADDSADQDRDKQVSVLEAFNFAIRAVARSYRNDGQLQTEHAVLDDSGDGVGARAPAADAEQPSADGGLAARVHLALPGQGDDRDTESGRARVRLQMDARRLVDAIEAVKRRKPSLEAQVYERRLEALLLELALNRRAYRSRQAP